ncbi:hypothetical protein BDP27DRAFT_1422008 [Rhodocollybia butyracea]|uniref:HNH nuclease domain-containing protein n=1 Tax=Rhodocollybia butyracea TaxID=206335 RepID=A0A9P5PTL6_9AGAR|nr:hypothetical protein BDP27DRAFT_1422008 [Rhodocollybia butyracea]
MSTTVRPPSFFVAKPPKIHLVSRIEIFHYPTEKRFLALYARDYPIGSGQRSGVLGLPTALVVDACRILTGMYKPSHSFCFIRKSDRCRVEGDVLRQGRYYLRIADHDMKWLEYRVYKNFHTWRPPSRAEVPSYWLTKSCPQSPIDGDKGLPPWSLLSTSATSTEMWSCMSNTAKRDDEYRCAVSRVSSHTAVEGAPVVPAGEQQWYMERDITEQLNLPGPSPPPLQDYQKIHDIRNFLTLDCHIRRLWDESIIVFYPIFRGEYSTFFVGAMDGHDAIYHHAKLHLADRTDPYLLYVRFAHTIFRYKDDFSGLLDALPELVCAPPTTTKDFGEGGDEEEGEGEHKGEDENEHEDEEDEDETSEGPFEMLFKEAEGCVKALTNINHADYV